MATSPSCPSIATSRNRYASPRARRWSPSSRARRKPEHSLIAAARALFLSGPSPVRSHLRQAFHIDGRALALLLAGHRLQQVERLGEIVVDRLFGRREIEPADLGE